MFVQTNSIRAVKDYFKSRLEQKFSESEIRSIAKSSILQRMQWSNADYLLADEKLVSESDLLFFRSIVKRLLADEPLQYVLGETVFFDLPIKCDIRALIPRPETEELVAWVLEFFSENQVDQILDLCTGTGCIALALKSNLPTTEVFAIDFSNDALALAKENSELLELPIHLAALDATNPNAYEQFTPEQFDCWVSNPPYIPNSDKEEMQPNVLNHEPHMALFVENHDALLFYREIAKAGLHYLKSGGQLFFEIHENRGEEVKALMIELGYTDVTIRKDLQGKDRMVRGGR